MPVDKAQQYVAAINKHYPLTGLKILEIGCGDGDITRSLAAECAHITAVDTDQTKLQQARRTITMPHITFLHADDEEQLVRNGPYDVAVYTLSLHHIPAACMQKHLLQTAHRLKSKAPILVVEPGESGSFMTIKKEFGAGSGDESELCQAAFQAMTTLPGFTMDLQYSFEVEFFFADEKDFVRSKLPDAATLPAQKLCRLNSLLSANRRTDGIGLTAQRWLYRLHPEK